MTVATRCPGTCLDAKVFRAVVLVVSGDVHRSPMNRGQIHRESPATHDRRRGQAKSRSRPVGGRGRDPLILAVGEPALEQRLQGDGPALDVPGSVPQLRGKQEPDAALASRTARGKHARLPKREQRLPGRERVAVQRWDLRLDVRFVAATNRDLDEEVAGKRFREDLYFRLNGVSLTIPPLRERPDELPALATLFLETVAKKLGQPPPRLAPDALVHLCEYSWPGNIRELRNVMERALLLASTGTITSEHLPLERMKRLGQHTLPTPNSVQPVVALPTPAPAARAAATPTSPTPAGGLSMVEIERQAILDALVRCAGNQTRAAELLGIPRRTFCKKLGEYNIPRPRV